MPKRIYFLVPVVIIAVCLSTPVMAQTGNPSGQDLAMNLNKGNCLACHAIPGDAKAVTSANIGPPLIAMKARFPDRKKLRAQIWDATQNNTNTSMPPFGKHKALTEEEIDLITDYVYGL